MARKILASWERKFSDAEEQIDLILGNKIQVFIRAESMPVFTMTISKEMTVKDLEVRVFEELTSKHSKSRHSKPGTQNQALEIQHGNVKLYSETSGALNL